MLRSSSNKNEPRVDWHDETLWFVRTKRDRAAAQVPEWEELREAASQIKNYSLSNMHDLLEQFEHNAIKNGITVHWAANADEHNAIIREIIQKAGANRMVKSKSMLTEECHLNDYLTRHGIEVIDSDLGERIVQLRGEPTLPHCAACHSPDKSGCWAIRFTNTWAPTKELPIRNT